MLKFMTLPNRLVQLYDADTNAKLGNEIRLKSSTGDGTVAGGAFSFEVPFAKPQRLTAEVIADAGSTRSPPSDRSELVVVGEWGKRIKCFPKCCGLTACTAAPCERGLCARAHSAQQLWMSLPACKMVLVEPPTC